MCTAPSSQVLAAASAVDGGSSVELDEPSEVLKGHLGSCETSPQAEASEEDMDTMTSVNKVKVIRLPSDVCWHLLVEPH